MNDRNSSRPSSSEQQRGVWIHIDRFSFGSRLILHDLTLSVSPGESVSILGPSGCGKSTLMRLMAGLLPREPSHHFEGYVQLFGQEPKVYRATGRLAAMFQDATLLEHLTLGENVALPLKILRDRHADVDEILYHVGLLEFRDYLPRSLSGGMRTRTALARAFVTRPDLLLLDEPFTGLDLGWKENLYATLQNLRSWSGTTVVSVTHDLVEAVFNSHRIVVIGAHGAILEELDVPGTFPRDYRFGETISRHTAILARLSALLGREETARLA